MKKIISIIVFCSAFCLSDVTDGILSAISYVESRHNDRAVNVKEDAVGRYQIQQAYFYEAQRICEITGRPFNYTLEDRKDPAKAKEIVRIYLNFWGRQYKKAKKAEPTAEVYFKIHNGHAFWKHRKSDKAYFSNIDVYASKALNAMNK